MRYITRADTQNSTFFDWSICWVERRTSRCPKPLCTDTPTAAVLAMANNYRVMVLGCTKTC